MSTPISGKHGRVKVAGTALTDVTKWSLTPKSENQAYASSHTNGRKKRIAGVGDSSGSFDTKYDSATGPKFREGQEVTLQLRVNKTDPGDGFDVEAIIDEVSYEVDLDSGAIVAENYTFSGNGALTGIGTFASLYPAE